MRVPITAPLLAGSNMDLRPGTDGSGVMAFLVVAALVLVCVFLYRSMRKHLRRIDVQPPGPPDGGPAGGSAGSEPT